MKKIALVVAALFALGFATTAMAAPAKHSSKSVVFRKTVGTNCEFRFSHIYWTGSFQVDTALVNCTNVEAVRFLGKEYVGQTGILWRQGAGGRDYNTSTLTIQDNWAAGTYYSGFNVPFFGSGCGAPPMYVQQHGGMQLKNSVQHSWGSLVTAYAPVEAIC